jgi:hypothetical protein
MRSCRQLVADRFAERIRQASALDGDEDEPRLSATTLQQLRQLAAHAESESVRVQALRVLLEREDAEREWRRREREATAGDDSYGQTLRAMSQQELDEEFDCMQAATIDLLLHGHEDAGRYPQTTALIEGEVERRVEKRLRELRTETAKEGEHALGLVQARYVTDSAVCDRAQAEPRGDAATRGPEGREPYHGWPSAVEPERFNGDEAARGPVVAEPALHGQAG